MRFFTFFTGLFIALPLWANDMMNLRSYGNDVNDKMYLFTSLACPHCAHFHQDVLPEIEKTYLNTNKAKVVMVDMLMNNASLLGAMLLRCAPKEKQHEIEKELYQKQKKWAFDEKKAKVFLADIAQKHGISAGEFETCIQNKDLQKTVITDQKRLSATYSVTHMPTLVFRRGNRVYTWQGADKDEIMNGLLEAFE